MTDLRAPFPWFGGKSRVAPLVWARFGDVPNYVEPFFGSGAVLLGRPHAPRTETVNDLDGYIANFWRALQADPDAVAHHADWPVSENDLHARHVWLLSQRGDLQARLEGDPDYYDARIAGWWVWGICQWIGSGWCRGDGPWLSIDGRLSQRPHLGNAGTGVHRQLPHLGNAGTGVHRKRPHLGDAGTGVHRQRPHLGNAGKGVHRKLPHLGDAGRGDAIREYMAELAARLRRVRVCCGDWTRVMGPTPTFKHGLTAVFLDPPYAVDAGREGGLYSVETDVSAAVREWAVANGDNPLLRIALCGYDTEHGHAMPETWTAVPWKARGGYGSQGDGRGRANAGREVVWFSPHCLGVAQPLTLLEAR